MKKINEVSKVSGVSIRTLQYYDNIGLLKATKRTESGYRLYDDTALEQLQQILLFRELKFPLKEIKIMMSSPNFDKTKALNQQIKLLTLRKERLDNLIKFAREIKKKGGIVMDFKAFNTSEIQEYAKRKKAEWGNTSQYSEFIKKASNKTREEKRTEVEHCTHGNQAKGTLSSSTAFEQSHSFGDMQITSLINEESLFLRLIIF